MENERIKDCTDLAKIIINDFETGRVPIHVIVLKCLRLCTLLQDVEGVKLFTYEAFGYPNSLKTKQKEDTENWKFAEIAGRIKLELVSIKPVRYEKRANLKLTSELENEIDNQKMIISTNKNIVKPLNGYTRDKSISVLQDSQKQLEIIRSHLYQYILHLYVELVYGNIVEDVFFEVRKTVDEKLKLLCPKTTEKFITVYNNMISNNPEDWANAVHSCRRILLDIADALYPAQDESINVDGKQIKVGKNEYINRLMQFVDSKKESETYIKIVGTELKYIGERLDAVVNAVNKGTHKEITQFEAKRFIISTYLLISDFIALKEDIMSK